MKNGKQTQQPLTVTLDVYERIVLTTHVLRGGIGNLEEALMVLEMKEDYGLTEEEQEKANFRLVDPDDPDKGSQWDDFGREFDFSPEEARIIKLGLRLVDKALYKDRGWLSLMMKFLDRNQRKSILSELRARRKAKVEAQ